MVRVTNASTSRVAASRAQLMDSDSGSATAGATTRQAPSAFSKGAVVSLRMVNFLAYKDAIAYFGPRLNMVVGPNGSGKSTLVCAIALGLVGSPKVITYHGPVFSVCMLLAGRRLRCYLYVQVATVVVFFFLFCE